MDPNSVLKDVPDDYVAQVRKDYESEGAKVTLVRQKDGKWTVVAEFGDPTAAK